MDESVKIYYQDLIKIRFRHCGALVQPSIFIDSGVEDIYYCGSGNDFMQIFINIRNDHVADIKYSCFCTPEANVAVEILCDLVKNKNLKECKALNEYDICRFIASEDEEFRKKSKAIVELFNIGINRYDTTHSDPI
jgi:NifU-like protein involved in Fe-S cluster formation